MNVVMVGAGLGGLSCAYRLMRHGVPSTVYESRERVGGRCWTLRVFDNAQTAEHGGQYIDSRHHQIRSLAKELRIPLVDTDAQSFPAGSGDYFWFDGAFRTRDEIFADFPLVLGRLKEDYQEVGRYFYNQAKPEAVAFDHLTLNDWLDANVPGGLDSLLAQAIDTLAMGTNAKLQFQLDRTLADLDWTGSFRSDEPEFGTWDSTYGQSDPHPETPVITIYTGGRAGAGYPTDVPHDIAPPAIIDTALDALARGVTDIHDAYNGIAYLDSWVDDPWVHGSYAGFGPGQYTDFWGFLEKREGNALFAGEHTSTHSQGYLNGGVESGERATRQILNTFG